jgi:hypothetical protein
LIPTLTPTLQAIFLSFSSCFTAPGLANFTCLVTGIIRCQGRHTITRVIQASGELARGKHHSTFYSFLSEGRWAVDELGRVLLILLLPYAKQSMGVGDPQNGWWRGAKPSKKRAGPNAKGDRGKRAVERTLPLFFVAYGITLIWYLRHGKPEEDVALAMAEAPWYGHKRWPSFLDMLAALRQQLWALAPLSPGRSQGARPESPPGLPRWFLAS